MHKRSRCCSIFDIKGFFDRIFGPKKDNRAATIARKVEKAGKVVELTFFEVLLEKLENDSFFKQHGGVALENQLL